MLGVRVDEVESGEAGVMLEDVNMGDWEMIWLAWEIDGGEVMIGVRWVGVGACLGMV